MSAQLSKFCTLYGDYVSEERKHTFMRPTWGDVPKVIERLKPFDGVAYTDKELCSRKVLSIIVKYISIFNLTRAKGQAQ